jgi:uncharacterized membrane-anchored protein
MKRILATVLAGLSPMIALAQGYSPNQGVTGLFTLLGGWLKLAVPLLISVAVVYFIYSVFRFMTTADDAEKDKAKKNMVWGIVAIFVMVSVWGLVAILQSTFGTSGVQSTIGTQLPL